MVTPALVDEVKRVFGLIHCNDIHHKLGSLDRMTVL